MNVTIEQILRLAAVNLRIQSVFLFIDDTMGSKLGKKERHLNDTIKNRNFTGRACR